MKYIVLNSPAGEAPVIFPRAFMHRYVAELFAPMPVISAGFVRFGDGEIECYGLSAGLKIASRPERDTMLVTDALDDSPTEPPAE